MSFYVTATFPIHPLTDVRAATETLEDYFGPCAAKGKSCWVRWQVNSIEEAQAMIGELSGFGRAGVSAALREADAPRIDGPVDDDDDA